MKADWWDGSPETITTGRATVGPPAMATSSRGSDNPAGNPLSCTVQHVSQAWMEAERGKKSIKTAWYHKIPFKAVFKIKFQSSYCHLKYRIRNGQTQQ